MGKLRQGRLRGKEVTLGCPQKDFWTDVEVSWVALLRVGGGAAPCGHRTGGGVPHYPSVVDLRLLGLQPLGTVEQGLSHQLCQGGLSTSGGCRSRGSRLSVQNSDDLCSCSYY